MATCKHCHAERPLPGAPTGSGWNEECRSCVAVANGWAAKVKAERERLKAEVMQFRLHLLSAKFQGVELYCNDCGSHNIEQPYLAGNGMRVMACKDCAKTNIVAYNKCMINTADVLRWLDGIEGVLRG